MANFVHSSSRLMTSLVVAVAALAACGGKSELELIESGKKQLEQKDHAGAIIQFKSALQQQPNSAQARLLLGKALLEIGDPVSAIVELRKAQEQLTTEDEVVPALARAMLMSGEEGKVLSQFGEVKLKDPEAMADLLTSLASAHLARGDKDKARATVALAQQRKPGFVAALVLEARLHAIDNDLDNALALLAEALTKPGAEEQAGLLKGEILWLGKKDADAAVVAFRKVIASNPKSVQAHSSIMSILSQTGKLPEAKTQLAELKKVAPQHPETLFFDAQMLFADGDYKASREVSDRLLKAMPENPRLLELSGAAEYRLKQYTQAEAFLAKALKNAPGLPLARHLLAQTYLRTNQPGKAVELLLPVVQGKNPDGTSLALAGEAWMLMGETKKADAAFALAEKVAPNDARVRTSAALAQMSRGNSGVAIGQLEAIAADDKSSRADVALISARLRQNDLPGALKAIDGLERKTPDRPVADNLRGRVMLLKKDMAGATKSFEAALRKDPKYFPAVASLAAIDFSAGKPDAARKRFEDLAAASPKSHEPWLALAELGARAGDPPEKVVGYLRSGVKANGGSATAHIALVNHLIGGGDGKAALTAAREASAALPNSVEVMDALGRSQMVGESVEQAVATFKQLTALQPTNAINHVRLAEALATNKDLPGAKAALRKALEIKPDLALAKRALVSLSLQEQRPEDGLALVKDMQKSDAKDPMAFALEGDVHMSLKNAEAAANAYRTALQLSKTTENFVRLHSALRAGGKAPDAERLAAEWLKDRPKDAALRYYLGDVAMASGNLAGAELQYRAVLEVQPRNALAMNNVAWLLVKQKKPGAVDMAQKANELMPGKSPLMDTLATALAAENQLPKAIEMQKSAIARSPNDPSLKLNLARFLIQSGDKAYARAELEDIAKLGDKFRGQAEVAELLKKL
jgi:cellulose synthase operon protein C